MTPTNQELDEQALGKAIAAFGGTEGECQEARRHMLGQEGGKALYAAITAYLQTVGEGIASESRPSRAKDSAPRADAPAPAQPELDQLLMRFDLEDILDRYSYNQIRIALGDRLPAQPELEQLEQEVERLRGALTELTRLAGESSEQAIAKLRALSASTPESEDE